MIDFLIFIIYFYKSYIIFFHLKIFRFMKAHPREILIYYNPESSNDRKTVAHAQGLANHIQTYSFDKAAATGTNWLRILNALEVRPKDLLNKAHPFYQNNIRGRDFNEDDWAQVLRRSPFLLKAPIAMRGGKAVLCNTATDIYKL